MADLLAEFDAVAESLAARGRAIAAELEALLRPRIKLHSVVWRVKERESLAGKLARPDRSYADLWSITDLLGIRVITYFDEDVDRVGSVIEANLPIDLRNSTDKRRREAAEFGYRSLHYVCALGGEFPESARYEIQVRTVLAHAWAEIEHDLGYKASAVPEVARRRLNRLAGLLELADQEFGAIRDDLEGYARALPARIEAGAEVVPIDPLSLPVLLAFPEVRALDEEISIRLGKPLGDETFFPDYLLKMLTSSGVATVADARAAAQTYRAEVLAMVAPYFEFTKQAWKLSPEQMPTIVRGYSLFFLAHVSVLRGSSLRLDKVERLARLYRELDYPEDPRTAHDVASKLVDAFQSI